MKITKKQQITGSKKGFIAAVDEAYRSNAINPTVRYSHAEGFFVESGLTPHDEDVMWKELAFYHASNGERSIKPSEYPAIRLAILEGTYE